MTTPTRTRRRSTSRALTPHPTRRRQKEKRDGEKNPTVLPSPAMETPEEEVERRWIQHFREAVPYVPHEFSTEIANCTVRRPYGDGRRSTRSIK